MVWDFATWIGREMQSAAPECERMLDVGDEFKASRQMPGDLRPCVRLAKPPVRFAIFSFATSQARSNHAAITIGTIHGADPLEKPEAMESTLAY
jgi:hypothetical protein